MIKKQNHLKPKINQINSDAKKTMATRIASSIFVILYFALIFLFGVLSDNNNQSWSPISSKIGRTICLIILLFLPIALIVIISHEIRNIYFKFKWLPYFIILFFLLLSIYGPIINYSLFEYFELWNDIVIFKNISDSIAIMSILLVVFMGIILLITFLLLKRYSILNVKNFLILSSIMIICQLALSALFYFLIKRQWTTLFYLMIIPIMMDSFAYFGGVLFGKRKMCPKISPKKTWEGFFIALLLTQICIALIVLGFSYINNKYILTNIIPVSVVNSIEQEIVMRSNGELRNSFSWWFIFLISSICASVISVIGDLVFSWFKRTYRIKDYGNLIPGHGGVLDRIDSHTFVLGFYFIFGGFIGIILSV